MTVFRELLSIKVFRENKAELAVRRQRTVWNEARDKADDAQRRLDDFRDYAQRHERELFDDLCRRLVVLRDIELVHHSISMIREQDREHSTRLEKAQDLQVQEEHKLDDCKAAHQAATRMKEKFVELARVHALELVREVERKEDQELEEVAEIRRDRSDWDEREETTP